jgi:arylsulfatase A-like enzyme
MAKLSLGLIVISIVFFVGAIFDGKTETRPVKSRNIIIFVADGLRAASVNSTDAPAMASIRDHGVNFANSHSLFPTFTTANASAIATGHYLGDTGDYSNAIYAGFPIFDSGNFGKTPGTNVPFVENDPVLADLDGHFGGNYLNEETLLTAARKRGFNTAGIGKLGPVAIQAIAELTPDDGKFAVTPTVIIDDATGSAEGIPLSPQTKEALANARLPLRTPARVQPAGNNTNAGTTTANQLQQDYFIQVATQAVLPMFRKDGKRFVLLYWSRDPDGSQHNQGDSLNTLTPGINGETSRLGVQNADKNLQNIMEYIGADPELAANTDIFITSDHGFATITKHDIDSAGHVTTSYSARWDYTDDQARREVNPGFLPPGFLAIDLAHFLSMRLFDPDRQVTGPDGQKMYAPVDPAVSPQSLNTRQHPAIGSGLIGGTGRISQETDAEVIVAANGGSDLIYLPTHNRDTLVRIVAFLAQQDYVGGFFVDDRYGRVPGALPLSSIYLEGTAKLPRPAVVVAFRTFSLDAKNRLLSAVQIADTPLQQGQGMHGSFGRDNTFNFMAAIGPDFKKGFVDTAPVSNADIAPTLASVLGFELHSKGKLTGRVIREALTGGPGSVAYRNHVIAAKPAAAGKKTILLYEKRGRQLYFDRACFIAVSQPSGDDCQ